MTAKEITLDLIIRYGFQVVGAIIILVVGVLLARWIGNISVAANPRTLKEPAPVIGVSELADSSIILSIQPWVAITDMVGARAELYQEIVERFRASKIDIPFPVREVRLLGAP